MKNKKLYIGLSLAAVAGIAIWYYTKDDEEDKSDFLGFGNRKPKIQQRKKKTSKDREGIKKCDCTYTGKAESKSCSKSQSCKACCEGGGLGDVIGA